MRIAVFGASGRTGREVVSQALERGHEVTAFVRQPERLPVAHQRLRVLAGDVLDAHAVGTAVRRQEGVVVALGPTKTAAPDVCSAGTRHIVAAMVEHGVRRLLCVTCASIGHPRDKLVGWIFPAMQAMFGGAQRQQQEDRRLQEAIVQESGLDWTLVRPPRLSKEKRSGNYRHGEDLVLDSFAHIGRADLARFILDLLDGDHYLERGVTVVY